MTDEHRIAMLIDEVLDELAKEGVINIRRAHGNWTCPHLNAWAALLHDFAIQPIQQFDYTKDKNATRAPQRPDPHVSPAPCQGRAMTRGRKRSLRPARSGAQTPSARITP